MFDSPSEDFAKKTLGALSGTLEKLHYVAGLKQGNGIYSHWGMTRVHGEVSANLAISQAHSVVFLSVLRTPVRVLWEEVDARARELNTGVGDYISGLMEMEDRLVPAKLQGGARRHFNSVLLALCSLAGVPERRVGRAA